MKYLSELLHKKFDTEEECLNAEKEYQEKKEKELEEKKKLQEERKARAEEIELAYNEKEEAIKKYNNLINEFVKDYGSYHYSIKSAPITGLSLLNIFDMLDF